jgi:hypothetical protein
MKNILVITMLLFSIQIGFSQTIVNKNQKDLKHFSIASEMPFENDCLDISNIEKRTRCLENELREQILSIVGSEIDYKGEMHLYFSVDKKGEPYDIIAKGFPSDPELEKLIESAVLVLELERGEFRGKKANIRCYTRVFPTEIR